MRPLTACGACGEGNSPCRSLLISHGARRATSMAKRGSRGSRSKSQDPERPSRSEAENAVRTLIRWAGEDPTRPGMAGTPARVVRAYEEWFAGYAQDPRDYLARTFDEIAGY